MIALECQIQSHHVSQCMWRYLQRWNSENESRTEHYCTNQAMHSLDLEFNGLFAFAVLIQASMFEDCNHYHNVGTQASCFDAAFGYRPPPGHARTLAF